MQFSPEPSSSTHASLMPTVFVGHGSPMNALLDNQWSRGFAKLGQALPTPRAILCISAHWMTQGTAVTFNDPPRTIHDFGGFPQALHDLQYRAPGDLDLARKITHLLQAHQAHGSTEWGLDHGTWSVLCHSFPQSTPQSAPQSALQHHPQSPHQAQIPVLQLSLDARKSPAEHLAVGRSLAPLREQGVLILGSGNITHNLRHALTEGARQPHITPGWASRFDADVAQALEDHDLERLAALPNTADGRLAHPSQEHYLPLLYVAAAGAATSSTSSSTSSSALSSGSSSDSVLSPNKPSFPITGFDMGSITMRAVRFG